MQYVVLDLEWNQPWPGSAAAKKNLPIHGEILQIGAVKLNMGQVGDEYQVLIRPNFYKKVNRKVSSLTGLKDARLQAEGLPFCQVMDEFRAWCGDEVCFFTWGYDDIPILRENLAIYGLDTQWVENWYNGQLIFNAQTDGVHTQRALKTALEIMEISPCRPAHDALGDAYHTALILQKLDLEKGIAEYKKAQKDYENGFHGAQLPGCLSRHVYHGFADKKAALDAIAGTENRCPHCGKPMSAGRWQSQQGRRYMCMAVCPDHGKFLLRVRLAQEEEGLRAIRLVYDGSSEAAKAGEKRESTAPRRRRRGKRPPKGEVQALALSEKPKAK